jgi:hypothetical protein
MSKMEIVLAVLATIVWFGVPPLLALWVTDPSFNPCAETVVGTTISNAFDPRAHIEVVEGVAICRCPVEAP